MIFHLATAVPDEDVMVQAIDEEWGDTVEVVCRLPWPEDGDVTAELAERGWSVVGFWERLSYTEGYQVLVKERGRDGSSAVC